MRHHLVTLFPMCKGCFPDMSYGRGPRGILQRGAILKIRLEVGALKEKKELERGAVLEIAGARSAEDKIGGWSAERKGQKGLERGAVLTPGPLPVTTCICSLTIGLIPNKSKSKFTILLPAPTS